MRYHHFVTLSSFMLINACSDQPEKYRVDDWNSMSSPASIYCVQEGGKLEVGESEKKSILFCVLSENEKYEQWNYYNKQH